MLKLYGSLELSLYIVAQARRHFHDDADQKDARSDAWEAVELASCGLDLAQYKQIAYRVINSKYKRWRRQHQREVRMA